MLQIILTLQKAAIFEGEFLSASARSRSAINDLAMYQYVDVCSDSSNATYGVCGSTADLTTYVAAASGFYEVDTLPATWEATSAPNYTAQQISGAILLDAKNGYYAIEPTRIAANVDTQMITVYDGEGSTEQQYGALALATMIIFYVAFAMILTIFIMMVFDLSKCCACNCCHPRLKSIFGHSQA